MTVRWALLTLRGRRMADAFPLPPLEPTRDPGVTLPDLLEVLLNRGVILHLDLIVAVADIPLIGISLRAAIAGIETMLEYGMMRQWDDQTRAWVQRSISRSVPFAEGEELIARMVGGQQLPGIYSAWRPATVYLTDRRLFLFRREPREMLWEAPLDRIRVVESESERSVGGEDRLRLRVVLDNGSEVRLSAAEPERLLTLLREQTERRGISLSRTQPPLRTGSDILREGQVWYHEPRAGGHVWRGGVAQLQRPTGLTWKSPLDARAAVVLGAWEIRGLRLEGGRTPVGSEILMIETRQGPVHLAAEDVRGWSDAILDWLESYAVPDRTQEAGRGTDG